MIYPESYKSFETKLAGTFLGLSSIEEAKVLQYIYVFNNVDDKNEMEPLKWTIGVHERCNNGLKSKNKRIRILLLLFFYYQTISTNC
jgi:hypothetical protein